MITKLSFLNKFIDERLEKERERSLLQNQKKRTFA
jgi:hypothetical protein